MRKNVFGRRFKRDTKERKALFKGLLTALVIHEGIKTTEQKAKSIKGDADRMVTHAKKGGQHARRMVERYIHPHAIDKLLHDITPRFATRQGGYTRITRIGRRFNDNATIVLIEWVERPEGGASVAGTKEKKTDKKKTQETEEKQATVAVETGKGKKETKKPQKEKTTKAKKEKKK